VNENYAFVVTCFSISILKNRFEYRTDFDADTEVVTNSRNDVQAVEATAPGLDPGVEADSIILPKSV